MVRRWATDALKNMHAFFMGKMLLPDTLTKLAVHIYVDEGIIELFQVSFMFCLAEYFLL